MMKEHWVAAAFTSDTLVAEILLRLNQSSSSDSSHALPSPATETTTAVLLNPIGWGNRKSRSKPSTNATVAVADGFRKEQQRSPSTPFDWRGEGAGAASTSDGSDESSRSSDLFAGGRSAKVEFANECSPSYIKSRKRKVYAGIKEEEGLLLKERGHLKRIDPKRETEQFVQISMCKVEPEIETRERPFVLPDLNMTPSDEELVVP